MSYCASILGNVCARLAQSVERETFSRSISNEEKKSQGQGFEPLIGRYFFYQ